MASVKPGMAMYNATYAGHVATGSAKVAKPETL